MEKETWILVIEESEVIQRVAEKTISKTEGPKRIRFFNGGIEAMHYLMQLMERGMPYPDFIYMDLDSMASKDVKYSDVFGKITSTDQDHETYILSLTKMIENGKKLPKKKNSKLVA